MAQVSETKTEFQQINNVKKKRPYQPIVWPMVFLLVYLHASALYGAYLAFTSAKYQTLIYTFLVFYFGGMGITAGVHRLWCHRTYKAKVPLRIILAVANCVAFQASIYIWSRDHRLHHKYTETDGDPYDASRGFFYSHMGWLMLRKLPEVKDKGKKMDYSDLLSDPIVYYQHKYYWPVSIFMAFGLTTIIPAWLWGESYWNAFFLNMLRVTLLQHGTWTINSAAHMFGNRPYDKTIFARESFTSNFVTAGEGFHNYHHVFPYDYAASEYGTSLNITTMVINLMHKLGLAYDLKRAPKSWIEKKKLKNGDGTVFLGL